MTTVIKVAIFVVIVVIVIGLIAILPTVVIDKNAVITSSAYQWIRAGLWFLPTTAMVAIFAVQISLWLFRLILSIIKVIWDVLPFF